MRRFVIAAKENMKFMFEAAGEKDIKRIVKYFRGREEVSALFVFGSIAKERQMPESDIDIAVLVDERKLGGRSFEKLKRQYYAASPYFSMRAVDIVVLNTAGTFLKYQILKNGHVLFDRNRRLRVRFAARALTEYLDFKYNMDIMLKGVTRRLKEGTFGR